MQQLLIDPVSALNGAFSAGTARLAAAEALRGLLGAAGTGGAVQLSVGPADIVVDLAATPPAVTVSTGGISLGGGPVLSGSARVDTAGTWSGTVSLTPAAAGSGASGLDVQLGGPGAKPAVALTFGTPPAGIPDHITLFPPPGTGQLAGIASAVLAAAGAAALRSLIAAVRTGLLSDGQRAKLDPVLTSLRLLSEVRGQAVTAVPFGLFTDPAGYLRHAIGWSAGPGPAADQAATLLDGLRALIGAGDADHGMLPLSPSVTISAGAAATGGLLIAIGYTGTEGQLASTINAGLTLAPGAAPVPHLDARIGLAGHTAEVRLALDGPVLGVTLHTVGGDIALLPAGPGLGGLAAAAQQALPLVLNALHDHVPDRVPAALDAVRHVLALGADATGFDGTQLRQFAANPNGELVSRLVAFANANAGAAFTTLQAILPQVTSPWAITANTSALRVSNGAQWAELRLTGSPPVLTVEVSVTTDLPGVTGASLTLDAVADTTGLRSLTASGQVAQAHAIMIGPLALAPVIQVEAGPAASPPRVAAGLAFADGTGTRAALLSACLSPVSVSLRTQTNGIDDPSASPSVVITNLLTPLVADAALHEQHVKDLLDMTITGTTKLGGLLQNVVLTTGNAFDPTLLALDPADLMKRLATLLGNIAAAAPPLALPDNLQLTFGDGAGSSVSPSPSRRASEPT